MSQNCTPSITYAPIPTRIDVESQRNASCNAKKSSRPSFEFLILFDFESNIETGNTVKYAGNQYFTQSESGIPGYFAGHFIASSIVATRVANFAQLL